MHNAITAFMSDHPAIQFKAGQKKGERYPCHGCYINIYRAKSIRLSFKRKTILLNNRIVKIYSSISSEDRIRRNCTIKIYNKLDLLNLAAEHQKRSLSMPQLMKRNLH